MTDFIKTYLDDIESRIDERAEDEIQAYLSAWSRHEAGSQDRPRGRKAAAAGPSTPAPRGGCCSISRRRARLRLYRMIFSRRSTTHLSA